MRNGGEAQDERDASGGAAWQREIGRELAAAVPDGSAGRGGVAGERDGVAGDFARVAGAESDADQDPGLAEVCEELCACEFMLCGPWWWHK